MSKLYPFSFRKHAHDIEFRKNRVWIEMHDMEIGETKWNDKLMDEMLTMHKKLQDLQLAMMNGNGIVCYLTGPQIGLAKETVLWAETTRAGKMR